MKFSRRFRYLFRRRRSEAEMAEEMRFHLEQRAAELAGDGVPEQEARYAAQRKFGNLGSIQERARETHGWAGLERFGKDLRFAFRQLVKAPGFTVLAIVTLGLGIGATTSMFSILNHLLLKPLPYLEPGQLDRLYRTTPQRSEGNFSAADALEFQRSQTVYRDVAVYTGTQMSLSEPGRAAELAYVAPSSTNLFTLLGTAPQLGRDFRADEGTSGRDRVAILSQRTWRKRFGGKSETIGQTIRLDGEPHEIVGVMPPSFNDWRHLGVVDVFVPLAVDRISDRQSHVYRILGRRAADRSPAEIGGFVANFGARLAAEHPAVNADSSWRVVPLRISAAGKSSFSVVPMLVGLASFVLLIACSNLANLLLARTIARAREFAVRAALGASRTQLLRPLIAESLLLALAGGGLAVLLALWFRDWAAVQSTGENGEQVMFAIDWPVALWTFGAALSTALAFGLAPALFALRLDINHTLKSGGRGMSGSRGHQKFSRLLIVAQFAFAMVLLAGAGLFIRGLYELNNRRAGWDSENLITANIVLPTGRYSDAEKIAAFHQRALERLAALPGVTAASISAFTPYFDWPDSRKFIVAGRDRPPLGREPTAFVNSVSPRYFDTFGTRVIAGRTFDDRDNSTAARVYVISQSTARAFFDGENPLGRRLAAATTAAGEPVWGEVVGVVDDVRGVVAEINPGIFQIYQPMAQEPRRPHEIAVRTDGVPAGAVADRIRTTIAELDPDLPVRKIQEADATIYRENYQLGVLRDVLTGIAVLGLGLAALGIYGVISRTMAQRAGEFAIRLALGACVRDLTRLVLTSGVKLALIGSSLGLLGALGVARVLAAAFPGMETSGVMVLLATTLALVGVALLACWLPARRAGRIDAMAVLRAE